MKNLILISLLFLQSCAPYSALKFVSENKVETHLPQFNVAFDQSNFLNIYKDFKTDVRGGIQYKSGKLTENTLEYIKFSYYSIEIIKDFESSYSFNLSELSKDIDVLINNEFSRNILSSDISNKNKGTIKWYVEEQKTTVNPIWFISSLATLFTLNIVGYPFISQTTELNLVITIFDQDSHEIVSYKERGKGTGYSAMYWGYEMAGSRIKKYYLAGNHVYTFELTNVAQLKAVSDALEKIKVKIQKDAPQIEKRLSEK